MKRKISILGSGESGVGAALLAKAKGFEVFVSDKGFIQEVYKNTLIRNNIDFEEGNHNHDLILASNEVIKSPGIPDKIELIKKIREKNIPIVSEIEFAARYTKAKLIGITGSNGKTTTTLFTYHLLKSLGYNVGLAGNIGDSFAKQVIDDTYDYYVLELSSFQLDGVFQFHPHISIILNITPDHLDRYDYFFQNYVDAKFRITRNLNHNDYFIYWNGSEVLKNELIKLNLPTNLVEVSTDTLPSIGAYSDGNTITLINQNGAYRIHINQLPLKGKHNEINMMCAFQVALLLGSDPSKLIDASKDFRNASHRMELVGIINGVKYINDSKATNVDSVYYALESMLSKVVLIAGGVDKGNDYAQIQPLIEGKVKAIVCLGLDNEPLLKVFQGKVKMVEVKSMHEAVKAAQKLADTGDTVLLSPACASFDLFKNYEDRGNQFIEEVKNLIQK
jgi:UDP-N-acetylmuramoylalanine--D-glutamate ligase